MECVRTCATSSNHATRSVSKTFLASHLHASWQPVQGTGSETNNILQHLLLVPSCLKPMSQTLPRCPESKKDCPILLFFLGAKAIFVWVLKVVDHNLKPLHVHVLFNGTVRIRMRHNSWQPQEWCNDIAEVNIASNRFQFYKLKFAN